MNKIKTILIKKDIISSAGTIVISKRKLLKLNMHTIDKFKLNGVYYEVLNLISNQSQITNTSSNENLMEVLSNNKNPCIQR